MKFHSRCIFVFAAVAVLAIPISAHAYVPPAEQILSFMVKALGSARGLSINQTVILYPEVEKEVLKSTDEYQPPPEERQVPDQNQIDTQQAPPDKPVGVELEGTILYKFPSRFREEISGVDGQSILVVSPTGTAKVVGAQLTSESEDQYDLFKDILLYRNPKMLMFRLSLSGVDVEVCSLGRWNGRIAYVIGAQHPDESPPQVWIDKETFLPLRFITTRTVQGMTHEGLEVHYENWQGLVLKEGKKPRHKYPARIVFIQDDRIISERIMTSYTLNPLLLNSRFDAARIKDSYEPSPFLMEERSLSLELEEVREVMEEFDRMTE